MRVEPKSDGDGAHWRLCGGYKIVYQLIAPKGSLERVCRQNLTALSEPKKKTKAKTRKLASIPKKSRSNTIRRGRTLKKRLIPKPPPLYKQNKPSGIDVKASPTRFGKMGDYYTSSLDSSSDSSSSLLA